MSWLKPPGISPDAKRIIYITVLSSDRNELWVADMDASNRTKITTAESLATATWSRDGSRFAFIEEKSGSQDKPYLVRADGSGLQPLNGPGGTIQNVLWSPDQKTVYLNSFEKTVTAVTIWKESTNGSTPEKVADTCGFAFDVPPGGKYLLTLRGGVGKIGIYQLSLADGKCTPVVLGAVTFGIVTGEDGKSFTYAIPPARRYDLPPGLAGWKSHCRAAGGAQASVCFSPGWRRQRL